MSEAKPKKYPAQKDATCIVCEDVRMEASGKLTLIGTYPGGSVRFLSNVSEDTPGRISLLFCFWFRKCRGKFSTKFAILNATGNQLMEANLPEQTVDLGQVLSFVAGVGNAEFKKTGQYKIVVSLDEREYKFPLEITSGRQPVALAEARK